MPKFAKARPGRSPRRPISAGDDAVASDLAERLAASSQTIRSAVENLVRSREQQQLADLQMRRSIYQLADLGASQRDIARLAGISQPEVSRRLARRAPFNDARSPREIILERSAGIIDGSHMVSELADMAMTQLTPGSREGYDGAATIRGTAKQLVEALHEGLITEREYEDVRAAINERRSAAGS